MSHQRCLIIRRTGLLFVCLLLAGCLGRSAPHVTYYSLLIMEQLGEQQVLAEMPEVKLGIGPITIPDSLKRSQIATRREGNQYQFDEFNRWAGVMEEDLTTVMGDNLGQLLGVDKIGFFPWMQHFHPDYRVMVGLERLDGELGGEAVLSARWMVADAEGKALLAGSKNVYRQPLEEASYAALVKAESQLVGALSREIASAIIALKK